MINAQDIKDEATLRIWLGNWPKSKSLNEDFERKVALTIGYRTTIRVLPVSWQMFTDVSAQLDGVFGLQYLLSNLISGLACKRSKSQLSEGVKKASARARMHFYSPAGNSYISANSALAAAADIAQAVFDSSKFSTVIPFVSNSVTNANFAVKSFTDSSEIWAQIRADALAFENGEDPSFNKLWADVPPAWFQIADVELKQAWSNSAPIWHFWLRWWEAAKSGIQMDEVLVERVASIDERSWSKGPEHIAKTIAKIETDLAIKKTPNSEDIVQLGNGLFDYLPASVHDPIRFKNAVEKVMDTVEEFRVICEATESNQFSAILSDLTRLETYYTKYANNPQRMHDVFLKTQRHLQKKIESGECPSDELILDLEIDVEAGAIDIRKSDKEVERTVKSRVAVRLSARKREDKERFGEAMLEAAEVSTEKLGSEIREDVAVSLDETADQEDRAESDYRNTSRGLRMARKSKENALEAADAAQKLGKGGEAVSTWWEWIITNVPGWFG